MTGETATRSDRRPEVRDGVIRVSIVLLAAAVRVVGANFGFPLLLHPDEFAVVAAVVDMAERNSFEPPWSYRPDHVEMKVNYGVFALYAHGVVGTSIERAFAQSQLPFYNLARLTTAVFGILTVVLAYLVGRRWSPRTGLIAAALFALFPPFVLHAHYATPDVPLTFAVMMLVYALVRYTETTSWAPLLAASFAVALAIGTKYPGAVGALMLAAVVAAAALRDRDWRRFLSHGAASLAATAGLLFLISPTLFTDATGVRAEIRRQATGDRLGHPDHGLGGNMWFYVAEFLEPGGLVLGALVLVGVCVVVARRRLQTLPWFVGMLFWVSLSTLPMTWERWGLPMWVTPLLLAAVGIDYLVERAGSLAARATLGVALVVVTTQLTLVSVTSLAGLLARDTRLESREWVLEQGISEEETTYEGYTPFLPGSYALLTDHVEAEGDRFLFMTRDGDAAEFVVLSDLMYGRVLEDPDYAQEQAIYRYIFDNFEEIGSFTGHAQKMSWLEPVSAVRQVRSLGHYTGGGLGGPTIRVFRIPDELRGSGAAISPGR
ncbi:ArnT family glycosyltransferase [Nocardioides dilutus]